MNNWYPKKTPKIPQTPAKVGGAGKGSLRAVNKIPTKAPVNIEIKITITWSNIIATFYLKTAVW